MRIVAISDTHEQHRALKDIPECDVLVHAGDMTYRGHYDKVYDISLWFGELLKAGTCKHVVCIPGNHDVTAQDNWARFSEYFNRVPNCHLLNCDSVEIDGIKFFGTPWTPAFGDGWAFQLGRGTEKSKAHWEAIPEDADVLVCHGPPTGLCDLVPDYGTPFISSTGRTYYTGKVHAGCPDQRSLLESRKHKLVICGHLHHGYGQAMCDNGVTLVVNASTCTEAYKPTNAPVAVDLVVDP